MRAASLPFTLFPVIRGADQRRPFWWDLLGDLASEQREGFITTLQGDHTRIASERRPHAPVPEDILPASWDVLRSARGDDCTFGVHGVTHCNLAELPAEAVAWELTHARDRIAEELGVVPRLVAYPYGKSNSVVQEETKRAGFGAGIGLDYDLIRAGAADMNLARVNVPVGLALPTFACWASGLRLRS
jgi:peptidoglycan/xylan/chitin deacetylase (PgdA/CDA1 family)